MPRYEVMITRTMTEYGTIIVDADGEASARAKAQADINRFASGIEWRDGDYDSPVVDPDNEVELLEPDVDPYE